MTENGAFKDDIQKKLGLTDEQNEEFAQLIDEMTKKDNEERAKRVAKRAIEEFKRRHSDWIM